MKKQNQKKEHFPKASGQAKKLDMVEMMPMDLAAYMRLAEKDVLPLIQERHPDAKTVLLLLAHFTYLHVTHESPIPTEHVSTLVHLLLGLWKANFYIPGSQYPYTFQETLQQLQKEEEKEKYYSRYVQPFSSSKRASPRNLGSLFAGIIKKPETALWQIWIQEGSTIAYLGTYSQPEEAQDDLEVLVQRRRGDSLSPEQEERWNAICAYVAECSEMLPNEALNFVLTHYKEDYRIEL